MTEYSSRLFTTEGGRKLIRLCELFDSEKWIIDTVYDSTQQIVSGVIYEPRTRRRIEVSWYAERLDGTLESAYVRDSTGLPVELDGPPFKSKSKEVNLFTVALLWTEILPMMKGGEIFNASI
jgi:hypothetical protein